MTINQVQEALEKARQKFSSDSYIQRKLEFNADQYRYMGSRIIEDLSLHERVGPVSAEQKTKFVERFVDELSLAKTQGDLNFLFSQMGTSVLSTSCLERALEEAEVLYPKDSEDFHRALHGRPFDYEDKINLPISRSSTPLLTQAPEPIRIPADWCKSAAEGLFYTIPELYQLRQRLLVENPAQLSAYEERLGNVIGESIDLAPMDNYSSTVLRFDRNGDLIGQPALRQAVYDILGKKLEAPTELNSAELQIISPEDDQKKRHLGSIQLSRDFGPGSFRWDTLFQPNANPHSFPEPILETALKIIVTNSRLIVPTDDRSPEALEKELHEWIQTNMHSPEGSAYVSCGHPFFIEYLEQQEAAGRLTFDRNIRQATIHDVGMTFGGETIFDITERPIDPTTIRFISEAWTHHLRPSPEGIKAFDELRDNYIADLGPGAGRVAATMTAISNLAADSNASEYASPLPLSNPLSGRLTQKRAEVQNRQVDILQSEIEDYLKARKIGRLQDDISLSTDYSPGIALGRIFEQASLKGFVGDDSINSVPWKSYTRIDRDGKFVHNFDKLWSSHAEEALARDFAYLHSSPANTELVECLKGVDYSPNDLKYLDNPQYGGQPLAKLTSDKWSEVLNILGRMEPTSVESQPELISLAKVASKNNPEHLPAILSAVVPNQRLDVSLMVEDALDLPPPILDQVLPLLPEQDRAVYVAANHRWSSRADDAPDDLAKGIVVCQKYVPEKDWENVVTLTHDYIDKELFPVAIYLRQQEDEKTPVSPEIISALTPRDRDRAEHVAASLFADAIQMIKPSRYVAFQEALNTTHQPPLPTFAEMADQMDGETFATLATKALEANRYKTDEYYRKVFASDLQNTKECLALMSSEKRGQCLTAKSEGVRGETLFQSLYGNMSSSTRDQREITACLASVAPEHRRVLLSQSELLSGTTFGRIAATAFNEYVGKSNANSAESKDVREPLMDVARLIAPFPDLKNEFIELAKKKEGDQHFGADAKKHKLTDAVINTISAVSDEPWTPPAAKENSPSLLQTTVQTLVKKPGDQNKHKKRMGSVGENVL